jgi:hypothetical protein
LAWIATVGGKPTSRVGAILVVLLWIAIGAAAWPWLRSRARVDRFLEEESQRGRAANVAAASHPHA